MQQRRQGDLARAQVTADGLTQDGRIAGEVEDVIGYLERDAQLAPESR